MKHELKSPTQLKGKNDDAMRSPYEMYKDMPLRKTVDLAVEGLVGNGDIVETIQRDYIVGHICKSLRNSGWI